MAYLKTAYIGITFLFLSITEIYTNEEFENYSVANLEHSFDSGPTPRFSPKGSLTIRSLANGIIQFSGEKPLQEQERQQLMKLIENDGLYRVRIPIKTDKREEYVENSIPVCQLVESGLSLYLLLSVDGSGSPVGLHLFPFGSNPICKRSPAENKAALADLQSDISTVVSVESPHAGVTPDTLEYLKRIEKQREEKMRSEQGDNRSFIAKYWMYLVPVVLVLVMATNNADPSGGGGGR